MGMKYGAGSGMGRLEKAGMLDGYGGSNRKKNKKKDNPGHGGKGENGSMYMDDDYGKKNSNKKKMKRSNPGY